MNQNDIAFLVSVGILIFGIWIIGVALKLQGILI